MRRVHVILWKEALEPERLAGKVAVVIDVLFATTTIAAALAHGAAEVIPAWDEAEARREASRTGQYPIVLAGERHLETIPGFASALPLALTREPLACRRLVYATTNGTVALRMTAGARFVCTAALVNLAAVAARLQAFEDGDVIIVSAGSRRSLSLEDSYAAGLLVERLAAGAAGEWQLSDAARAVRALAQVWTPEQCLEQSRIGRIVAQMGAAEEVRYAAQVDTLPVVPVLQDGRLHG